jgi:hypothetical protein
VHHERLISGVAAALGLSAAAVTILAFVYEVYALIILSLMLGAAAGFMWYQASGRLAAKIYRSVEQQGRQNAGRGQRRTRTRTRTRTRETGGFGAGPREDWTPPGDRGGNGARQRARANGGPGGARQQRQRRTAPSTSPTMGRKEAYRTLGVSPDADEDAVKRAYREKVKEVHPDTEGGDEEAFKKVNRAYERLT